MRSITITTNRQRGDTLIEVLLAITVLATVISVSYAVMSRGFSESQIAYERTATQALMNGQSAMLRDAQERYIASRSNSSSPLRDKTDWETIISSTYMTTATTGIQESTETTCSTTPTKAFYFRTDPASINDGFGTPAPYGSSSFSNDSKPSTAGATGKGLRIEGLKFENAGGIPYYNFYIKACWLTPYGGSKQEMRTIVRLYES